MSGLIERIEQYLEGFAVCHVLEQHVRGGVDVLLNRSHLSHTADDLIDQGREIRVASRVLPEAADQAVLDVQPKGLTPSLGMIPVDGLNALRQTRGEPLAFCSTGLAD